ncbi:PLDc N-terminal domain-containing protein [Nocardia bovistercoris]|uniref:PLDc N-terminal domain-containing protein n=1 Tax=Nocardia bovistercoris TaxID=2785916 RepID=A0A931N7X5_9NOCA|nr:PLDc N-terminal domain-containing protein [Nocardia bovistercoris]MBH0781178.1 PLDc N-terminal domain-containing protein [Nocardia bovistercoris]
MDFWDIIWFIVVSFLFIAYLMVMFSILMDLFRDHGTSGWAKAAWVVLLLIFPFLTALVYLIVRGKGMAERRAADALQYKAAQDDYIRKVAGADPAAQIASGKKLLDEGTITSDEFDQIKRAALH